MKDTSSLGGRTRRLRGRVRPFARPAAVSVCRPALWRVGAGMAAVILCALLLMAGPGSMQVYAARSGARLPAWTRPCVIDTPPARDADRLASCVRMVGRVIATKEKSSDGERHVLVTGGFHVMLVELPPSAPMPGWGSRITAVGRLERGVYGVHELIALSFLPR